jgi:GDPmannose 4,6-dehydratase
MAKKALIFGVTGQDGSYLADLLISKAYEVHGTKRRSSTFNTERIDHLEDSACHVHYADLSDPYSITKLIKDIKPDEVYNLAAQSHVRVSFDIPAYTLNCTGLAVYNILEAIRDYCPETKYYQASSSEMFGGSPPPQNEFTAFQPKSPYAIAKTMAYNATVHFRDAYGIFATNGILFNHESPRRGETFVTRKITRAVARIKMGIQEELYLGNLAAIRDWGYAPEYVNAMWEMMQLKTPDDYVIATGQGYSVRDFLVEAFSYLELDYEKFVRFDERLVRPAEVDALVGDSSKAENDFMWSPKTDFHELVKLMVRADLSDVEAQLLGKKIRIDR